MLRFNYFPSLYRNSIQYVYLPIIHSILLLYILPSIVLFPFLLPSFIFFLRFFWRAQPVPSLAQQPADDCNPSSVHCHYLSFIFGGCADG